MEGQSNTDLIAQRIWFAEENRIKIYRLIDLFNAPFALIKDEKKENRLAQGVTDL